MKTGSLKVLIAVAGIVAMGGLARATTFYGVSPQSSFLLQSANDVCSEFNIPGCNMSPTFIDLNALGAHAGDTLTITPVGGLCFYAGSNCTIYPPDLGGVFSTSNTLLGPSVLHRLPGAIAPGSGASLIGANVNLQTFTGHLDMTIAEDFYLPATVVVPTGANFLVVGVLDSGYSDNSSTSLGVDIDIAAGTVSEPGTYAMVLGAISLLWLRRRSSTR